MLTVKLFGTGEASYYDHPLPGFPSQQPCLLLCHLLLNQTYPHNRDHLAALFWGEMATMPARKYLRNALWRLRQVLQSAGASPDTYLFISEESISFIHQSDHWLDVAEFEEAITALQDVPPRSLTAVQALQLEEATRLYVGDLLVSVYDDWVLFDRERLRILYLNTLSKLMVYYGLHGSYERGLTCGEHLLAVDNTREKIHRQIMWLYYLQGDRNAALAQYKHCRQVLREELNVQPMEETSLLYDQMLHNQFDPKTWAAEPEPTGPLQPSSEPSLQTLVEMTLQRISHLQTISEETTAELNRLERLFKETIALQTEIKTRSTSG